jgi:hypothetical protein
VSEALANDLPTLEWAKQYITEGDMPGLGRIVGWISARGVTWQVSGDSLIAGSTGWLTVSALEGAAILSFSRLSGYEGFDPKARARFMKKVRGQDAFPITADGKYVKVPLGELNNEDAWQAFEKLLDLIADIVGAEPS